MQQLIKDQEAVDQVKQIVEKEEAVMKQETKIVENYSKVSELNDQCRALCPPYSVILLQIIQCLFLPGM